MNTCLLKQFSGLQAYTPIWQSMRAFTLARAAETPDELWLLEHKPVLTLGQAGKPEHILDDQSLPIVKTDRGGQVTYHGPGQLVMYPLFNIDRLGLSIRDWVNTLEALVIQVLDQWGIQGQRRAGAPGVYVNGAKIAALGLRVKKACSYHGLALNVEMDMQGFSLINPCGYPDMAVTDMASHLPEVNKAEIKQTLLAAMQQQFNLEWQHVQP